MKKLFVLILIICALTAKSQLINSDNLYNKIVMLRDGNGKEEKSATGFILTDNNAYFLVTSKHVAKNINLLTTHLFFGDTTNIATKFDLKDFIPDGEFSRSNDQSDCYLIKLVPFDKTSERILKNSALPVNILSATMKSISRNLDLLVMGFPVYDLDKFRPITFKSYFASSLMTVQVDSITKPSICYLLEHTSMEGCSGAPVFVSVKDRSSIILDKTFIVGMVSGATGDHTGAKYSVVVPAYQLVDLIYGK